MSARLIQETCVFRGGFTRGELKAQAGKGGP